MPRASALWRPSRDPDNESPCQAPRSRETGQDSPLTKQEHGMIFVLATVAAILACAACTVVAVAITSKRSDDLEQHLAEDQVRKKRAPRP